MSQPAAVSSSQSTPNVYVEEIDTAILQDKKTHYEILSNFEFRFTHWLNGSAEHVVKELKTLEKAQKYAHFLWNETAVKLVRPFLDDPSQTTSFLSEKYQGRCIFYFSSVENVETFHLHCRILTILENSGFTLVKPKKTESKEVEVAYVCETKDLPDLERKFDYIISHIECIYAESNES